MTNPMDVKGRFYEELDLLIASVPQTDKLVLLGDFNARKTAFNNIRQTVQTELRNMQDSWLSKKADETQIFADSNNVRCLYEALNTVYGPRSSGSSPVLNADGTKLLTDRKQILEIWAEHFNSALNRSSSITNDVIDRLPQSKWYRIKYRTDNKLFNIRRMQAATKVKENRIRDLLFADDCALNATNEHTMQLEMDRSSTACDNFGLTTSTKKTEVMYQPAPGKPHTNPEITVKGQTLQAVHKFTYLGSTLTNAVNIDVEVNNRIAKACAFGRLHKNVWDRRGIRLTTKLEVYRAVILSTLLYACETWTICSRHGNGSSIASI
ncbi:hypothetical protein HOLleu_19106 [Holothuria leucospilota]|uniref:Endonuclease/exonuclease/phosphatase domain-containing protein n=1 Tax=Holothuria leucospilota TaxID=206669 RepID=A0A9Q1C4Q2_HOLLE|nr:hypothetical protein HOLleu_19106 [Holothuria leucospilota]